MPTPNNSHRPLPHEQNIPLKYQDDDEPMSGPPSAAAKAPDKQKVAYQKDVCLDWEALVKKLAAEGFKLNTDATLEYIAIPDYPRGVEKQPRQLILRNKAYAEIGGRRNLIGALNSDALSDYQQKIARCLYNPGYSKQELKDLGAYYDEWQKPDQVISDRNWRGETAFSGYGYVPRKMIPSRDQFSAKVQALSFGDIFNIFQGPSLEQLKLFIGRVMLGQSGTIDPVSKQKLKHTYRNILVINGSHAGQGKTHLFECLVKALERVGFNVNQSCPPLSGRFNHRAAFTSDLIYRDDSENSNIAKELSSPQAKILATNGWVSTEEKGENAIPTKTTAAMLILANRLDQRLFWGMDDGMRSRITLCSTEPEGSIPDDRKPLANLARLAEECECEVDTLMLWACRLAADEFAKYTNENAHLLEGRVKELEDLADNSNSDPLDGTLAAILLGYLATMGKRPPKVLDTEVLAIGLKGMLAIKQTPDAAASLGNGQRIPAWSPAQGLRWVNPNSILTAYHKITSAGVHISPNNVIKQAMESLSLRDGNHVYGNTSVVMPRWSDLVNNPFTLGRIQDLCDKMVAVAPIKGQLNTAVDTTKDIFWNS